MPVVDRDLGYAAVIRQMSDLAGGARVVVGVRAENDEAVGDTNLATIATVHEFGSDAAGVPERSFLRSTVDEQASEIADRMTRGVKAATAPGGDARRELGKIGAYVAGEVRRKIVDLRDPENADSTIEAKGSDNPLIDTGRLRQSIDFEVRGG